MAFEVEHNGRKRLMISMDYSGEIFRRAFVEDGGGSSEAAELMKHLDNAGGVILLLDASTAYRHSGDMLSHIDSDFGMVQAVKRVRDWAGGERVPVAVVLTKADKNLPMIQGDGGPAEFVKKQWPALVRTLKRFPTFLVSAVQTQDGADGKPLPRADTKPVNVEKPLEFVLQEMEKVDQELQRQHAAEAAREAQRRQQEDLARQQRRRMIRNRIIAAAVVVVILIIVFAVRGCGSSSAA
jgi:hypothetical protein